MYLRSEVHALGLKGACTTEMGDFGVVVGRMGMTTVWCFVLHGFGMNFRDFFDMLIDVNALQNTLYTYYIYAFREMPRG